jgi:2,4-diaminopentanoate dehydrogenase
VIATAARAVNMIEPVCTAPSGLLAARDLPAAHIRGVMW